MCCSTNKSHRNAQFIRLLSNTMFRKFLDFKGEIPQNDCHILYDSTKIYSRFKRSRVFFRRTQRPSHFFEKQLIWILRFFFTFAVIRCTGMFFYWCYKHALKSFSTTDVNVTNIMEKKIPRKLLRTYLATGEKVCLNFCCIPPPFSS